MEPLSPWPNTKKEFEDRVKEYLPKRDRKFLSSDLSDEENLKLFRQMKILKRTDKKDFQEKLDRLNYVRKAEEKKPIPAELFDFAVTGRLLQKNYESGAEEEKYDKKNKDAVYPEVKPKKKNLRDIIDKEINNVPKEGLLPKIKRSFEEPKFEVGDVVRYVYKHVHTGEKIVDADYLVTKVEKKDGDRIYTLALMTNKNNIARVKNEEGMRFAWHKKTIKASD